MFFVGPSQSLITSGILQPRRQNEDAHQWQHNWNWMGSKSSRSVELFLKFVGDKVLVENQIGLNSYNSGLLNSFIIKFRYNARWLIETACFIRVQMHGATVSRHQPVCEMPGLLSPFIYLSFFGPRRLIWPRKRKRALSFNGYRPSCV